MRAIPKKSAATPKDYVLKAYYKDLEQWAEDAVKELDRANDAIEVEVYVSQKLQAEVEEMEDSIENYGRHQFNRGCLDLDLIPFDKWKLSESDKQALKK